MPLPENHDARRIALSVLEPDERLLWSGQPDPFRMVLQTWPIFVIALPWTLFALYWTAVTTGFQIPDFSTPDPYIFLSFTGMIAALIGLSLLTLPFLAWRRAGRTVYAVADGQCLIIIEGRQTYVNVYRNEDIGRIRCKERGGGTGDLLFSPSAADAAKDLTRVRQYGFYGIADVRRVEDIVRKALSKP
jgi:hypothetical protein